MCSKYQISKTVLLVAFIGCTAALVAVAEQQEPLPEAAGQQAPQQAEEGLQSHLSNLISSGGKAVKSIAMFPLSDTVKPYLDSANQFVAPYVAQAPGLINPTIQKIRGGVTGLFGSLANTFSSAPTPASVMPQDMLNNVVAPVQQQITEQAQNVLPQQPMEQAQQVANQAQQMAQQAAGQVQGVAEQVQGVGQQVAEQAQQVALGALGQAQQVAEQAQATAQGAAGQVQEAVAQQQPAEAEQTVAQEAAEQVAEQAAEGAAEAKVAA